jgi:hypothetical protein
MLASEKVAIAAHLHVLLRRKTGRVTDTEWMAQNAEYAAEIVRFSRAKAVEEKAPELADWAAKLEHAMATPTDGAARPLLQAAVQALARPAPAAGPDSVLPSGPASGFADSLLESSRGGASPAPAAPRYVGGIR